MTPASVTHGVDEVWRRLDEALRDVREARLAVAEQATARGTDDPALIQRLYGAASSIELHTRIARDARGAELANVRMAADAEQRTLLLELQAMTERMEALEAQAAERRALRREVILLRDENAQLRSALEQPFQYHRMWLSEGGERGPYTTRLPTSRAALPPWLPHEVKDASVLGAVGDAVEDLIEGLRLSHAAVEAAKAGEEVQRVREERLRLQQEEALALEFAPDAPRNRVYETQSESPNVE